jgi:hypothetical protein
MAGTLFGITSPTQYQTPNLPWPAVPFGNPGMGASPFSTVSSPQALQVLNTLPWQLQQVQHLLYAQHQQLQQIQQFLQLVPYQLQQLQQQAGTQPSPFGVPTVLPAQPGQVM